MLFTAESVTEGHPDKMADQISDAIVDEALRQDPASRVAIETLLTNGLVVVAGEMTTKASLDIPVIVRDTIRDIGYTDEALGFHWQYCGISVVIQKQSPDIARGVDAKRLEDVGAGDQGIMIGYATNETPEMMPLPITLAHALVKRLAQVRKTGILDYLGPDGKSQVTIRYNDDDPKELSAVVISTQHLDSVSLTKLRQDILRFVIKPVIPPKLFTKKAAVFINPTGRFVKGGPCADTGVTGRKIVVDAYGPGYSTGGGCFSGKDPTKVDRSAAYGARWVAKNIVAAKLADRCEVRIAYAIGKAQPLMVDVNTFSTGKKPDDEIAKLITKHFDLRPGALIKELNLRRPLYRQVAAYGHFGRSDLKLPWEEVNKIKELKNS
ncbi:MAG: methionine adenosyltransferase [Candidatus Portnoybacteria bacterium]|nr:methionine adenosyltransferase [Candidatus Portnoybacteria bacterium]